MNYKIKTLPLAMLDLEEIDWYLGEVSVGKAGRFFTAFKEQRNAIKRNPRMYREYGEFPPYRIMPVLDYMVFYIVNDNQQSIEIHRILWAGMDFPNRLKDQ